MSRVDIGFHNPRKERQHQFTTGFRCSEETVRQLCIVKEYLEDLEKPPENLSATIREAIKFGSIWCRQQKAEQESEDRHKKLQEPDVFIVGKERDL